MARPKLTRAVGPVTMALTMLEMWQRLPPQQRRLIAQQVRRHGPRLAKSAGSRLGRRR